MAKARTIYIFEGEDNYCICRGEPLIPYEAVNGIYYRGTVKHRGDVFGGGRDVNNINEIYLGSPKKLSVKGKIAEGWQAIKVHLDYNTGKPYIPDIPAQLISRLAALNNEVNMWKKKYFDAQSNVINIENKDRFEEKMRKTLKFSNEMRQQLYGYSDYSSPFSPGWLRPSMGQPPSNE
jgi:hypothetical protein